MLQAPKHIRDRISSCLVRGIYHRREFREAVEEAMGSPDRQLEHERRLFSFLISQVLQLLTEEERHAIAGLHYMTVPTTDLNALIVRDQGAVVLVFSMSMHTLPLTYAQWLAAACEALRNKRSDDLVLSVARLLQLAEHALTGTVPRLLQSDYPYVLFDRPSLPEDVQPLVTYSLGVAQLFVVGHEIGHFYFGTSR